MRLLGTLLIGLVLGYAALAALLYVFQSRFIYFPEMGRHDRATPAQLRLPFEEVRILDPEPVRDILEEVDVEEGINAARLIECTDGGQTRLFQDSSTRFDLPHDLQLLT